MSWKSYILGDILKRKKSRQSILENKQYNLVTIRLHHRGVYLRSTVMGYEIKSPMFSVKSGDFILSGIDARNGAFGIVPQELDNAIVTNDFWCLETDENIIDKDFFLFLTSTNYFDDICKKSSDGTTQRMRLQKEKFFDYPILLPSIVEQREIVKSLKEYNKTSNSISALLSEQQDLVNLLRQAYLTEAFNGKLVKQFNSDGNAIDLLYRIREERLGLAKINKIQKDKKILPIKDSEIPYKIPANWVWCRLGELIQFTENLDIHKKYPPDILINYVDIDTIDNKKFEVGTVIPKPVSALSSRARRVLRKNYILYSLVRPYLNNIAIIKNDKPNYIGSTGFAVFKGILVDNKFLKYFLISDYVRNYYGKFLTKFNSPSITYSQFINTLIPLPPQLIQKRIVDKLEELINICDNLEETIKQSKEETQMLLQSSLREALMEKEPAIV